MKSTCFIKLDILEETEDGSVIVNASNISTIKRLNYNDTIQTFLTMIGGERLGVHQTPAEVIDLVEAEKERNSVLN